MHQVRYFLAVCRTLNFTKAAEECNVAQPSLTRAVQKLEEELGGALFHRERANTHLTELGRLMLPHLEQTYAASQAAKALANSVRKGEIAPLRLAVDTAVSIKPIIDMLTGLKQSIQGLELTLGSGTRVGVTDKALDGAFDLVVTSQAGEASEKLRTWTLFREQCQAILPKSHRFAGRTSLTLADLDKEQMVARIDCCLQPTILEACRTSGINPDVRHCAAGEDQLQRMVLSGFGIGISPPTIALIDGLIGVPMDGEGFGREVALATVPGRRFSIAADAFIKVARARDWSELH